MLIWEFNQCTELDLALTLCGGYMQLFSGYDDEFETYQHTTGRHEI
jgi:hypothetical protein